MYRGEIRIKLAEMLPPYPTRLWAWARQVGVTHAVTRLAEDSATQGERPWDYLPLLRLKQRFEAAGLSLWVIESRLPSLEQARLGLPGRDEEIENFRTMLRNLGRLEIPIVCWNWMAKFGWLRTATSIATRGGATASGFNQLDLAQAPVTAAGQVPEAHLWDTLRYFLEAVVPAAGESGVKLALHPDDPPLPVIRGVARIIRSPEAMQRATELVPSPNNGITYCQGNFAAMQAEIPQTIRSFGSAGKIHFVHFRDIRGSADRFVETFHDDGQTDMLEAMRAYFEIGFDGPIRCDHVPTLEGEANETPGYGELGRLFAIGYIKGLMEAAAERATDDVFATATPQRRSQ